MQVSVLEMDGQFDKIEELIYVESHLSNTSAKFYGEITQQMLKNSQFPGSNNGTGLFQTIVGLKIREVRQCTECNPLRHLHAEQPLGNAQAGPEQASCTTMLRVSLALCASREALKRPTSNASGRLA